MYFLGLVIVGIGNDDINIKNDLSTLQLWNVKNWKKNGTNSDAPKIH